MLDRQATESPEIGPCRAGQHGLGADAAVRKFVVERSGKRLNESLCPSIDAVEQFGRDRNNRGDIDHRAAAARYETGHCRIGQAHQGGHVEAHHSFHAVDITFHQRRVGADTSIVDQRRDAGIRAQHILDAGKIGRVGQIGCKHSDRTVRLVRDRRGKRLKLVPVAGNEDQVVAARGKTVSIDRADAGGGAGDECSSPGGHGSVPCLWRKRHRFRQGRYGATDICPK
ncbi:hypothetical protein D3C71_1398660 [compost metagenome]